MAKIRTYTRLTPKDHAAAVGGPFKEADMAISFDDFLRVDMRVGRIVSAEPLAGARKPAYKLAIDFGDLGMKHSSAQITELYNPEDLPGKLVVAVTNFEPKRIAGFKSEVLVLGLDSERGGVSLLAPGHAVAPGTRVY